MSDAEEQTKTPKGTWDTHESTWISTERGTGRSVINHATKARTPIELGNDWATTPPNIRSDSPSLTPTNESLSNTKSTSCWHLCDYAACVENNCTTKIDGSSMKKRINATKKKIDY